MKKFASVLAVTAAIALIAFSFGSDNGKFGPRLTARLETNSPDAFVVWVFFSDKGPDSRLRLSDPSALLTQRSLERRLKVKPPSEVIDISDVPVFEHYVASVSGKVLRVRNRSRWFNAVSVELNRAQLGDIASLGFVSQIELVETYIKVNEDRCGDEENSVQQPDYNPLADTFNYGNSFNQINQIKVNLVHNQVIFGQGVMIASFDNGWRNQTHEAFTTLPMKVVPQYDFQLGRPGANYISATT